jgi:hypothetical protein
MIMTTQPPYTLSGLARALRVNRTTLLNYQDPAHYSDVQSLGVGRIYDLNLKTATLAEESALMLLDCLVGPAVIVVRQVEFGPVGVALEEL